MNLKVLQLAVIGVILTVLTWKAWQHRYVAALQTSPATLSSLLDLESDAKGLNLAASKSQAPTITKFLPWGAGADYLHVATKFRASNLIKGHEKWQGGRHMLAWRNPKGERIEWVPLGSAEDSEDFPQVELALSAPETAVAAELVFQNLGESGSYLIEFLVLTPVTTSPLWTYGKWILALLWIGAAFLLIRTCSSKGATNRQWIAAALWAGAMIWVVFPGPWRPFRALPGGFCIQQSATLDTFDPVTAEASKPLPPPSGVSRHDTPIVIAKNALEAVRPLIHGGFFGIAALLFSALSSYRAGITLAVILSLSVEGIQIAFGFSPDFVDLLDIAANISGIAVCILLSRTIVKRWQSRRQS